MDENGNYIGLVKQAQLGDKASLNTLVGLVRGRLYAYVYRIVLRNDAAQDIVQESMLEMFKILGKLEKSDRFWPWLRGIAFNKIRGHYAQQKRHKTASISGRGDDDWPEDGGNEALADLIGRELKQVVVVAMRGLKPEYRKVLTMRCYEQMEYSEIAELMECSEIGARVTFCRAKKALHKQLSRKGFGKGMLLPALALFGKMTAPSEAAAAQVSVTAASTKVGVAAGVLALSSAKVAVVSLTTAGVITIGTMMATSGPDKTMAMSGEKPTISTHITAPAEQTQKGIEECWYYYPEQVDGPVMMRVVKSDSRGRKSYCRHRQNEQANYHFDRRKNTIYINNYRMWRDDLAVWWLPTDNPKLRKFLAEVEGPREQTEYIRDDGVGLLVVVRRDEQGNHSQVTRHYNVLDEEYFRYDWPAGARTVDNRDAMHKRGWTYFEASGEVDGKKIRGTGRIPFVYATSGQYRPWLRLQVANGPKIIDIGTEACVYDAGGEITARYEGGSFFKGLGRPWMGLHTIDTIRRDAAEKEIWFEMKYKRGSDKTQIVLTKGRNELIYTIDMEKDVVDKITFSVSDKLGQTKTGEMRFTYLQEINQAGNEFVKPRVAGSYRKPQRKGPGVMWLFELITDY